MKYEPFIQKYTAIFISVKFLGFFWEFWSENIIIGDDRIEFFRNTREKYKKKFKNKKFKMRLYYPNEYYLIENENLKHLT